MPDASPEQSPVRYVALDIHQEYIVVLALNGRKEVVMPARSVRMDRLRAWAQAALLPTDRVVLEATGNTWDIYDQLEPLVRSVTVANPNGVQPIAASRVKTDRRDARVLAELLLVDMIPEVWVPPHHVRELRSLVAHRRRQVQERTRLRNRLHAVLLRHNLAPPGGELFSQKQRSWWLNLPLSDIECLRVRQDLEQHDFLCTAIAATETQLGLLSNSAPWADAAPFLLQLPGVGLLTAMVLLSAIGDITRFPNADKLVGYAGLGASVHSSGKTQYGGPITKRGRRELRTALVEAAWTAIGTNPFWAAEFAKLEHRIGRKKAIVAIARKLLVVVWHVLTDHAADRHASPEKVARKFYQWAHKLTRVGRHGLTSPDFVARQLTRVRLGTDLTTLRYGRRTVRLPAVLPRDAACSAEEQPG